MIKKALIALSIFSFVGSTVVPEKSEASLAALAVIKDIPCNGNTFCIGITLLGIFGGGTAGIVLLASHPWIGVAMILLDGDQAEIPALVAELGKRYYYIDDPTVINELAHQIALKIKEKARTVAKGAKDIPLRIDIHFTETEVRNILFPCDLTQEQVRLVVKDLI